MTSYVEKQIKLFEDEESSKKSKTDYDPMLNMRTSSPIPPFNRSFSSSSAVDMSAYNSVTMDVLDMKTMLVRMKRLLEQDGLEDGNISRCVDHSNEINLLKDQLISLQSLVEEKDQRIQQLEARLNMPTETISTQTIRNPLPVQNTKVIRPLSLHNLSYTNNQGATSPYRPCHHVWGPCANDHTHHHSRGGQDEAHNQQSRSSSTGRTSTRSRSPWGYSSSSSSGSSPVARKTMKMKEKLSGNGKYNRTSSMDLLTNNPVYQSNVTSRTEGHKLCIYVNQK